MPPALPSHSSESEAAPRPLFLTLPESTNSGKKDSTKGSSSTKVLPKSYEDDLFASDSLFGPTSFSDTPSTRQTPKTVHSQAGGDAGLKKDKSTLPSFFYDNADDLFQKATPNSAAKKVEASSFLEDDDDYEDIFKMSDSSTPTSTSSKELKNSNSFSKQDIFQVSPLKITVMCTRFAFNFCSLNFFIFAG